MIVTEHVTGCLTEQPPDSGSAGARHQGTGVGEGEQKHQEFCLLEVVSINTIINVKEDLSLRGQKNHQSLCPTNLCDGSYKGGEKNETNEPMDGLANSSFQHLAMTSRFSLWLPWALGKKI